MAMRNVTIGTSHFVSYRAALAYYNDYAPGDINFVDNKITSGEITIGQPESKPGFNTIVNSEGRYTYFKP